MCSGGSYPPDCNPKISLMEWLQLEPKAYVVYIPRGHTRVFFESAPVKEMHLTRLVMSARAPTTLLPDPLIGFEKVNTRLLKDPRNARRNSSVKTIYKCNHNLFIVSKWFTFGLFRVEEGEQHVYTSNASILLYHMSSVVPLPDRRPPTLQRRTFLPYDFPYYTEYVLRPDTTYTVPPGTRYLIITVKKCYFTVDKVASDAVLEGSVPFDSHRTHGQLYAVPPPSPMGPALVRLEERHHRRAAKRTRCRGPQREEPGCSSWPSPTSMEVEEPRSDTEAPHSPETFVLPDSWETPRAGSAEEAQTIAEIMADFDLFNQETTTATFENIAQPNISDDMSLSDPSLVTPTPFADQEPTITFENIAQPNISDDMSLSDPSLVIPTPFATAHASNVGTTSAVHVPFVTTAGGSTGTAYFYSVPFDTTPGGSSVAYVLPVATSSAVFSDTTPMTSPVVTRSTCAAVASLPAPRLWRRDWTRRQRTAAQAHAIVFQHRKYLWEHDDAPGMGSTLRAAMDNIFSTRFIRGHSQFETFPWHKI
ncbi:hypothetical protein JTE90_025268 [Oedothorax gibbosus]|uniref:Uncharacterized protein n=1 Tax=Oedothorax gibbosus TaxID=931172 RepID=A0AAV6U920_9ARAC|nr:hypothetical protein JTE90_025268 [Oedothorax gibbosus]